MQASNRRHHHGLRHHVLDPRCDVRCHGGGVGRLRQPRRKPAGSPRPEPRPERLGQLSAIPELSRCVVGPFPRVGEVGRRSINGAGCWLSRKNRGRARSSADISLSKARNWRGLIAKEGARGGATMFPSSLKGQAFAGSILVGLIWATPIAPAAAQQKAAPPDLSSNQVGWISLGGDIMDVLGAPRHCVRRSRPSLCS
jgi:hypothetical protein